MIQTGRVLFSHSLLFWLETLGVATFAAAGVLVAARHRLDLFGALVVAFVSTFGGGTLRDVLLGLTPVFWLKEPFLVVVTLVSASITFVLMRFFTFPMRLLLFLDAIGLGLFAVLGANRALATGISPWAAAPLGMLSGAAGGAMRDVMCGEIPSVFLRSELYATTALAGAILFCALTEVGLPRDPALFLGALCTFTLRIMALRFKISLPVAKAKS